jgi:hypothetical protein
MIEANEMIEIGSADRAGVPAILKQARHAL